MKTMKKLFALVLAMVMLMALALPVMAADPPTYPITIKPSDSENAGEHEGHIYEAYQILSGTASDGADGRTVLADIKWGTGFPVADFLTALKNNTAFGAVGANLFDDLTSDDEGARKFAEKISMNSFSAAQKEALAQTVSNVIGKFNKDKADAEKFNPIASAETTPYVLTVPAGYYMIKDKDGWLAGKENVDYTDIILQVSEEVDVHHKGSIPTVKKEVSEYNSEYGEYIGVAAGTEFYYKLIGTLPEDFANYDKYQYTFSDELGAGIDYVDIERVFISRTTGDEKLHKHDPSTNPYGYQVKREGNKVKIEFADLKHDGSNPHALKSSDKIVVIYKAKLNGNAVIGGTGNENTVKLEYSNNPNGEGKGFTSTDSTKTYTYGVRLEKYDGETPATKLQGVKFLLYREVSVSVGEGETKISVIVKEYAEVVNNCIIAWHKQDYGTTTIPTAATYMETDANGIITIRGLDSSKDYYLQETATNDGFNKIEDPIKFNLTATLDTATETITAVSATVTSDACHVDTANPWEEFGVMMGVNLKVPNYKGTVLPTTGGMGTTLFYVLGSILVIGAVVLLVTKKRMTY